ncbi:hypothetical protein CsatB_019748 [Cannabis sativa]
MEHSFGGVVVIQKNVSSLGDALVGLNSCSDFGVLESELNAISLGIQLPSTSGSLK